MQLLVVSALAVLGALLTAGLLAAAQTGRQAAALERLVRSEVAAEAGFYRLVAAIEDPADTLETAALQGQTTLALAGNELLLGIETNGSKIDVPAADLQLIERYARQAGLDGRDLSALLAELGAARADGDGSAALEALRVAMTGLLPSQELNRDITRFGGSRIDPTYASRRVLHAVPDLSPADADRIAAAPPAERAQYAQLSRYFASGGRRFALVTRVAWGATDLSEGCLPIEISTAGRVIVLAEGC
ncbi:hypothetical protein [Devosia insulae]|uniref:hypothetical protein n=1 Tax=Devosia insulae TaxID=408174 RepID=UPI00114CD4EF|nr:hypothetical protein [Devosia insulae]